MKNRLWIVLPILNILIFIPVFFGVKPSLCDHPIYAVLIQIIISPFVYFLSKVELLLDLQISDVFLAIISICFYFCVGLLISKFAFKKTE